MVASTGMDCFQGIKDVAAVEIIFPVVADVVILDVIVAVIDVILAVTKVISTLVEILAVFEDDVESFAWRKSALLGNEIVIVVK